MAERLRPGEVRDAILGYFRDSGVKDASVAQIRDAAAVRLGRDIPASSVRSYLNLNTPGLFLRTARGQYTRVGGQ